ncbi:MAG: DUF1559 domain-containing protein [Planctomycetia bacterium]
MNHVSCRRAFTVAELVVVIAIIGLLIALVPPAVQAARESSRRAACAHHLQKIGVGLAAHEQAKQTLPMGVYWNSPPGGKPDMTNARVTWLVYLLPFVESAALFDSLVLVPPAGLGGESWTMCYPPNGPTLATVIPWYRCPADADPKPFARGAVPGSRSNYVGCFSPDGTMVERAAWGSRYAFDPGPMNNPSPTDFRAAFNWNVARPLDHVRDGAAHTIAAAEVIAVDDDHRGNWWLEWGAQYSHSRPPNSTLPDEVAEWSLQCQGCNSIPEAPCVGRPDYQWSNCNFAARSRHAGGVNGVMLDGAVRFFGDGIDLRVWRAIASIDGGEPPSADF